MSDNNKKEVNLLKKALHQIDEQGKSSCLLCRLTLIVSILLFIIIIAFVVTIKARPDILERISLALGLHPKTEELKYTEEKVFGEENEKIISELTRTHQEFLARKGISSSSKDDLGQLHQLRIKESGVKRINASGTSTSPK
jgi:hypothetical protein